MWNIRLPVCFLIAIAVVTPSGLLGQTVPPSHPAFEVASIKLSPPTVGMAGYLTYPGGRVRFGHQTLKWLIRDALEVQSFQISGGPGWIDDERYEFDIDARVPASSQSSKLNPPVFTHPMNAEQCAMLLTLLEDRFQLKFHRETRNSPVYFLQRGTKPLKLVEGKSPYSFVVGAKSGIINGDGIRGVSASMALLARTLSGSLGRLVIDRTGIAGSFDFRYDYVSDDPHPDVASTLITSVEEIGLKLKAGKAPVETIVIDRAEKPSPN